MSEAFTHDQPQIEGGRVQQHALSKLLLAAYVTAAHATRLQQVREDPLQLLATLAQQPLAARAMDAAAVGIRRLLRLRGRDASSGARGWVH